MTQEMQRITHQGGKIIRIIPLSSETRETLHPNLHLPWWVEITTTEPRCVYFFGPFENEQEAQIFKPGYLEDLEGEDAQGISCCIKQCQPQILTQEF
jgi:hypothetical protein